MNLKIIPTNKIKTPKKTSMKKNAKKKSLRKTQKNNPLLNHLIKKRNITGRKYLVFSENISKEFPKNFL
jgi:hypothetical protein